MKKRLFPVALISLMCLSSCNYPSGDQVTYYAEPIYNSAMVPVDLYNSTISLTAYNKKFLDKVSPLFQEIVSSIHIDSDRYNYFNDEKGNRINNLRVINESYGSNEPIKISDDLYYLLDLSLQIHELSEGYFNPTMGSLIDLWNETIPITPGYGKVDIVGTEDFNQAFKEMIPYSKEDPLSNYIVLNEKNKTVTFKKYKDIENIDISLGGVAKGYGMQKASEALSKYDAPMMIDGGSSSLSLLNDHPKNENGKYKIGIASPYSAVDGSPLFGQKLIYAVNLGKGTTLSTSGDYLHYIYTTDKECIKDDPVPCKRIKEDLGDGKFRYIRRHHILNPFKGYSENYYLVINIHAPGRAVVLDALTTTLFNIDVVNDRDTFLRVVNNFEKAFDIEVDFLLEQEISFINEDNNEWSNLDIFMSKGMKETVDLNFKPEINVINSETIIEK